MASSLALSPLPTNLKPIAHLLKIASEHETRDPVVTYWARLSALQTGLSIDKKSKEATAVLIPLMDWLEKEKKVSAENEAITSEIVASAHIENYSMKLFAWADQEDRAGKFGKNVVKAFYTAGVLFDVLVIFGNLTPENAHVRKYAKWKAAYIHNCLKNGETPVAGPLADGDGPEAPAEHAAGPPPPENPPTTGSGGWSQPAPIPAPRAQPAAVPQPSSNTDPSTTNFDSKVSSEKTARAQKLCKFAISALDYDDVTTAIDNMTQAIELLKSSSE